jgi:hypothetical protein
LAFTCIGIELQPDLTRDYFQKRLTSDSPDTCGEKAILT